MEIVGNAVIQKDGTLILPQEVIQRLELKFGDELFFVAKGGEITISKLPDAMKRTVDYYLAIGCDRLGGRKRLTGAKANPDFTLTLTYEEREERIYDCKPLLEKGGVFVHLRKYENFARVFIEYGAVCWDIDPNVDSNEVWNNRIDLCPDSCYIDSIPACAKGLTCLAPRKQCWRWASIFRTRRQSLALQYPAKSSGWIGENDDLFDR